MYPVHFFISGKLDVSHFKKAQLSCITRSFLKERVGRPDGLKRITLESECYLLAAAVKFGTGVRQRASLRVRSESIGAMDISENTQSMSGHSTSLL